MMDIAQDLLSNFRFVSAMSILWLAIAWIARGETTVPAKLGAIVHGILAMSPILAISAYATDPETFEITVHVVFATAHGLLLFFTATKGRGKRRI